MRVDFYINELIKKINCAKNKVYNYTDFNQGIAHDTEKNQ